MSQSLLIEPHYLGSLEYFGQLVQHDQVTLEVHGHFTKQTFKNRTYFLSPQGAMALTIPVRYCNHMPLHEVTIDYDQPWVREHWGALFSCYGKAPFFEHFADGLRDIWHTRYDRLVDLNQAMLTYCLKCLRKNIPVGTTDSFEKHAGNDIADMRELIHPKKHYETRDNYLPVSYPQLFGNKFVPNLGIVDLLMCEGSRSLEILLASTRRVANK